LAQHRPPLRGRFFGTTFFREEQSKIDAATDVSGIVGNPLLIRLFRVILVTSQVMTESEVGVSGGVAFGFLDVLLPGADGSWPVSELGINHAHTKEAVAVMRIDPQRGLVM